jgi:hypothetical protein
MANTFELIASSTVGGGGVTSVTFSSIPATYTDLVIKLSCRTNNTGAGYRVVAKINGSAANFTGRNIYGSGITTGSGTLTTELFGFVDGTTETANTFANNEIYFPNYAGANYKSISTDSVMENNATQAYSQLAAGLWSNTAAITSITLYHRFSWTHHLLLLPPAPIPTRYMLSPL